MRDKMFFRWQNESSDGRILRCFYTLLAPYCHPDLPLCIRSEIYEQGPDTGPHSHEDFYALYIVQGGCGVHVINEHPYSVARGDVYLMPPGAIHAYRDYSALTIDAFYFQPQLFHSEELSALRSLAGFWRLLVTFEDTLTTSNIANIAESNRGFERLNHRLHLSPECHRDIEDMITELYSEYASLQPEACLLTRSLFFRLLIHLARWQGKSGEQSHLTTGIWDSTFIDDTEPSIETSKAQKQHQSAIAHVLHLCEEHFHEPLSIPQLAGLMFLSPSRFSEVFHLEVGMSPAAYIRRLRLDRAQTLLRTTSLTNTEIAHQVGFRDGAQLSRAFREIFHITPSTYRASFRSSVPSI